LIEHCTDIDPENSLIEELRRRKVTTYSVLRIQACFSCLICPRLPFVFAYLEALK